MCVSYLFYCNPADLWGRKVVMVFWYWAKSFVLLKKFAITYNNSNAKCDDLLNRTRNILSVAISNYLPEALKPNLRYPKARRSISENAKSGNLSTLYIYILCVLLTVYSQRCLNKWLHDKWTPSAAASKRRHFKNRSQSVDSLISWWNNRLIA